MRGCLDNLPTKQWGDPVCGNGFIELGEDCDCGQADCTVLDPCCNGNKCKLAVGAVCSATEICCTPACMYENATVVCRARKVTLL
jgi:hypothetical protein